ncbi:MAG: Ig-like domain-containing protein, partial [Bacteroidota bacterium]|nr:Ig-like domain-containing protein [Bacteroidota bacterium]
SVNASTGLVTAVSAGNATITYTVSSGCNSPVTASAIVTVNPNANAGVVSGTSPLCIGASATYSSNGDIGGTWSSSNTAVASVNAATGVVTAVSAGTATITYTVSSGCNAPVTASASVTVNPNANAGTVSGTSPLCIGSSATYSSTGDAGGTWSSSNTAIATVNAATGLVTAISAGTATITYTVSSGCNVPVAASAIVTVNAVVLNNISGDSTVCIGQTLQLTNSTAGGIWTSSNNSIATINNNGLVSGISSGNIIITYSFTNALGCSASITKNIYVNQLPVVTPIMGNSSVCSNAELGLSDSTIGGKWSSSNSSIATIDSTGSVHIISSGIFTANYSVTNRFGCSASVSKNIIIIAAQNLSINPKNDTICTGHTINLTLNSSLPVTKFTWTSSTIEGGISGNTNDSIPIITNAITDKLVNNEPEEISVVKYTITAISNNNCSSATDSAFAIVYPVVTIPKAGKDRVICQQDSIQLNGNIITSGTGTWYQISGPSNVSFSDTHAPNAVVTKISNGNYVFAWVSSNNICSSASDTVNIVVKAPTGLLQSHHLINCISNQINFAANVNNTDSIQWNFGDGNAAITTASNTTHSYTKGGIYFATAILKSKLGCSIPVIEKDTVKVEELKADFILSSVYNCGKTTYNFKDSSGSLFGIGSWTWITNNKDSLHQKNMSKDFSVKGNNTTKLVIRNSNGCSDSVKADYNVKIYEYPVADIDAIGDACKQELLNFDATVVSSDSIAYRFWDFGNGVTSQDSVGKIMYYTDGSYGVKFIVSTVNKCYDSAYHQITVHPAPTFTLSGANTICRGDSVALNVTGNNNYIWKDANNNIICSGCTTATVQPTVNTSYQVIGYSQYGCSDIKTTSVQVIQPFVMNATPSDSICIGTTKSLYANGAKNYKWYPSDYLSSTTTALTTARPLQDITYHVIGKDDYNCFTDTAEIKISVGKPTTINIGLDTVLQSGDTYQFNPRYSGTDINSWSWQGSNDLSCINCETPTLAVKKDVCIICNATNVYNCAATDTVCIKVFCPESEIFVPNAFTPDGDGINDKLMVQGRGIKTIKSFRIFNRWGELVFERTNFMPGDPSCAWDGTVRGKPAASDVFVYICEVVCEAGYPAVFKGNVGLIK